MTNNQIENVQLEEKGFDFKMFFFKYILSYWYLYVITIFFCLGLAYYYNWYTTPVYKTSTTLLIKDDKQNPTTQDFLQQIGALDNQGGIENEMGILKSRNIISRTIQNLNFDVSYYLVGDIKISELYNLTPIRFVYDTLRYGAYGTPISLQVLNSSDIEISYEIKDSQKSSVVKTKFGQVNNNELGIFKIEKTETFDDALFNSTGYEKKNYKVLLNRHEAIVDKYLALLNVDYTNKKSTILQLSIEDPVPQKGVDFLNKLIEVYLNYGIELKNEITKNTLKFIDEQLAGVTKDLSKSEDSLKGIKTTRGITDLSTESATFLESAKTYDIRISEIDLKLSFLGYLERYLRENKNIKQLNPASIGIDDALLIRLVNQLNDLMNQRERQSKLVGPENPILVTLTIQIENTRRDLLENVKSIRDGLTASRNEAQIQLNRIQGRLKDIPGAEREIVEITREKSIREGLYTYLLTKRAETAILMASTISDNRVVDYARTIIKPVRPVKAQTYAISLLLGLLIPAGFVYLKDALNDSIRDKGELERQTSIPLLGMIGVNKYESPLIVSHKPGSMISEAFRSIRTNLQYFSPDKKKNIILITSSISSEGKSFCSMNLALIYALSGKKTVLIGCDLRKPKIVNEFKLSNEIGVSNYLIGAANLEQITQPSGVLPNLDVIVAGPKTAKPCRAFNER
ncbi:MAG: hypothetical protein IPJ79_12390 [Bacteroidetes bacterium]|nr:hypothetical protein [Bacteroidota bacterium]